MKAKRADSGRGKKKRTKGCAGSAGRRAAQSSAVEETGLGRGRLAALALSGALLVVLAFALLEEVERARARLTASRTLHQVETMVTARMRQGNLRPEELQRQIALLRRIAPLDPSDFAIPMSIGSHFLLLENAPSAIRWYERALELETRPEIALNLSRAHEMAGHTEEARRYREMAEILDPRLASGGSRRGSARDGAPGGAREEDS